MASGRQELLDLYQDLRVAGVRDTHGLILPKMPSWSLMVSQGMVQGRLRFDFSPLVRRSWRGWVGHGIQERRDRVAYARW